MESRQQQFTEETEVTRRSHKEICNNSVAKDRILPLFVTFEGCDGCGKSTQSKMLYEYLISKGLGAIHTREIGGTEIAENIRSIVLHEDLEKMSELMLVMAARYEHITKVILPALFDGKWVVCDRFVDSTACYQSGGFNISIEDVYAMHNKLMLVDPNNRRLPDDHEFKRYEMDYYDKSSLMPDVTFLIDIPPEISLARAQARQQFCDNFDSKPLAFYRQIYDKFKLLSQIFKDRIITIEGFHKESIGASSAMVGLENTHEANLQKSPEEIHKIVCDSLFI